MKVPIVFDRMIEIKANSPDRVKHEYDQDLKMMRVDRIMSTCMFYPTSYGFIFNTIGGDGDPLDVLIHSSAPLESNTCIKCRAVGVLFTEDEKGQDAKIIAVPISKVDPELSHINSYEDLPPLKLKQIQHFFMHYKDLEEGKWVKILRWGTAEEAANVITSSFIQ